MLCHGVQEKEDTGTLWTLCCGLIGSRSHHVSHENSQDFSPDELILLDVWYVTRSLSCLHLTLFDMWHESLTYISSVVHVLTLNCSSVSMKGKPRRKQWCQNSPRNDSSIEYAFHSEWSLNTVYVTLCILRLNLYLWIESMFCAMFFIFYII